MATPQQSGGTRWKLKLLPASTSHLILWACVMLISIYFLAPTLRYAGAAALLSRAGPRSDANPLAE